MKRDLSSQISDRYRAKSQSILIERFPKIALLAPTFPSDYHYCFSDNNELNVVSQKGDAIHDCKNIQQEMISWASSLSIENVEVLYVYGIGLGYAYDVLKPWLKENPKRDLVFLEDDCNVLSAFFHTKRAKRLLADPQVHLFLLTAHRSVLAQELAEIFPVSKSELVAIPYYQKNRRTIFRDLRLKVLRKTTLSEAIFSDRLYSFAPFSNFFQNLAQLPYSFYANKLKGAFQNVPAIICGAGPSLEKEIPYLKQLKDRALIIAGGSAITALSSHGIEPHLGMAVDPNLEEYKRLKASTALSCPLLYSTRVHPRIFETFNGPIGYLRSGIGGLCELWMEEQLDIKGDFCTEEIDQEALSVTTVCVTYAKFLGCNPIIFTGVDLAYTGNQRYAKGVIQEKKVDFTNLVKSVSDRLYTRKSHSGKRVQTTVKWIMESACISTYAKTHPETTFINATEGGIGFKNIPYVPLQKIPFPASFDLEGEIHAKIQEAMFFIPNKKMQDFLSLIQTSLLISLECIEEMNKELAQIDRLQPTGKMVLAEMDLKEQEAYRCLLYDTLPILERFLRRKYKPFRESEKQKLQLEREKWQFFQKIAEKYKGVISSDIL